MMKNKKAPFKLLVLLVTILIFSACSNAARTIEQYSETPLNATGFLESDEVSIVSEASGMVKDILVEEGQSVSAGETVLQIDNSLLMADRIKALASVGIAQANLDNLLAGASEEEVNAAQSEINQAQAQLDGIEIASGTAWMAADNPAEINTQIAVARMQADLALQQIAIYEAKIAQQQLFIDTLRADNRAIDIPRLENEERLLAILISQKTSAEEEYQGSLRKLEELESQLDSPLALIAQARAYSSQIPIAELGLLLAEKYYEMVSNGASPEEIAVAEAQLKIAQAQVALIDAQIAQLTLKAPINGVATTRSIFIGEIASPGIALMTLSNLDSLRLIVYIPEPQIGRVSLGAEVEMTVDAYPGEVFSGIVTKIANEAEFTPKNVQTEEERVNLVFAVEIIFDNDEGLLKPGMPADIVILE